MTDPFYMLVLIENLGREHIVWDKTDKAEPLRCILASREAFALAHGELGCSSVHAILPKVGKKPAHKSGPVRIRT